MFDWNNLYQALDDIRDRRRLAWKDVAEQTGVNASSLTRLGQGKTLDVDNLTRLLMWGGLSFDQFTFLPTVVYF